MKKLTLPLLFILLSHINFALAQNVAYTTHIANAVFTTGIQNRVPQDDIVEHNNELKKLFFFTDVRNLSGTTITHRWFYKNKLMAEVPLTIEGPRWRTWSSKNLWHTWLGQWRVEVVDEEENILLERTFDYYK